MIYLILKIALYLLLAALVGVGVGWFLRQISAREKEEKLSRELNTTRSRIPQLETSVRNREQQASRLLLEIEEWKEKLPALESNIVEKEKALLERDRTISAMKAELGVFKQQNDYEQASDDSLFGGEGLGLNLGRVGVADSNLTENTETPEHSHAPQSLEPHPSEQQIAELLEALELKEQELLDNTHELQNREDELSAIRLEMQRVASDRDRLIEDLDTQAQIQARAPQVSAEDQNSVETASTEASNPDVDSERLRQLEELEVRLTQQLKQQQDDYESLTNVLDGQNGRVKELSEQAEEQQQEIQRLSASLNDAREASQQQTSANEAREETIRSLEERVQEQSTAMAESLNGYTERIAALQAERDESIAALQDVTQKLEKTQELARKLAADLKDSIRAREALSNQEKTNRQKMEELTESDVRLKEVQIQSDQLQDRVEELEQVLERQTEQQAALVADYDDRLNTLHTDREQSRIQLESLGEQLESTREINRSLSAELNTLQQSQEGLLDQRTDFDNRGQELERLRIELQQAESAKDVRNEHIKELEKRIQEQTEAMADVLNGHTDKVNVLNQIRTEQEKNISELKQKFEDLEQLHANLEQELEEARAAQERANASLSELQRNIEQKNRELDDLQSSVSMGDIEANAKISALQTTISDKEDLVQALQTELSQQSEEAAARISEQESQIQEKTEQIAALEADLIRQADESEVLLRDEQRSFETLRHENQARLDEMEALKLEHVEREKQITENSRVEKEALLEEVRSLTEMLEEQEALRGQISITEEQIKALQQSLTEQGEELNDALSEQKKLVEQHRTELAEKDAQLDRLSSQLEALESDSKRFAGVSSEAEQLRKVVDDLRAEQKDHEVETLLLQEELSKLEKSLAEKEKQQKELQDQLEANQSEVTPLFAAVESGDFGPGADGTPGAAGNGERDALRQLQEVSRSLDQAQQELMRLEKERVRQETTLLVLNQQLEDARETNQRLSADRAKWKKAASGPVEPEPPTCLLTSPPDKVDDFKQIKGIGKAVEEALNGLGIYQFQQLVELEDEDIQWVDEHLDRFRGRITRDDWIGQAAQLSSNGH